MTTTVLALKGVSFNLPNGAALFSNISEHFDTRRTGLVGANGIGKTVLARILAGELAPNAGQCIVDGSVHYLEQQISPHEDATVASLAGVDKLFTALHRIEMGSADVADFECIGESWDIRTRFEIELARCGLASLDPQQKASTLSGGEVMRLTLIRATLSSADFIILDEPSNHLDRESRTALIEQLQRWHKGLLVISHDRELLNSMERIVELSSLGLRSYGGNYTFYAQCKAQERAAAQKNLEQMQAQRKLIEGKLREEQDKINRRQAQGGKRARVANQAKILLGRQKQRSQNSSGKLRLQHEAKRQELADKINQSRVQIEEQALVHVHHSEVVLASRRRVVQLEDVVLPYISAPTGRISLQINGQERVGVLGSNGSGKSTLLKLLAGIVRPVSGQCTVDVRSAFLDQNLSLLDPQRSTIEQLLALNSMAGEDVLRMRLAQLGLDEQKISVPSALLSGGERLKAALSCAIYSCPSAELLLLDEPSNHLDIESTLALENMLRSFKGALFVASHDYLFLDNLALTQRLVAGENGWQLEPW